MKAPLHADSGRKRLKNCLRSAACAGVACLLVACASAPPSGTAVVALTDSAWVQASTQAIDQGPWQPWAMPGKKPGAFDPRTHEGQAALAVEVDAAVAVLRKRVRVEPAQLGAVDFSWWVPALLDGGDLASRDLDDTPVRVVLAFEGDRSRLSARDQMFSELVRSLSGEDLPYATLMYVWSKHRPVGTVIHGPRTDRIRKLVVDSGPQHLGQWRAHRRHLAEDFQRVFGEPAGALVGVGVMSDTDNTRSHARAWYGPIRWVAP